MLQRWSHLLFLHWAWDPAAIQRTLPPGLYVDTHEGQAWVGLVPFFMERVRPRGFPPVPGVSNFLELNVRTYVRDSWGRTGVWFYSLDANQWLAVKVARRLFHLPYQHAEMSAHVIAETGEIEYRARRAETNQECRFVYHPMSDAEGEKSAPDTLDFFLVERYRLFAWDAGRGRLYSGRVHHTPYRIGPATGATWSDTMLSLAGFDRGERPPDHVCTARAVDVEVWPLERVASGEEARATAQDGVSQAGAMAPA